MAPKTQKLLPGEWSEVSLLTKEGQLLANSSQELNIVLREDLNRLRESIVAFMATIESYRRPEPEGNPAPRNRRSEPYVLSDAIYGGAPRCRIFAVANKYQPALSLKCRLFSRCKSDFNFSRFYARQGG
jgi:hypothetical protein